MIALDEQPVCEYCGTEMSEAETTISLAIANASLCEMCI